MALLLLKAAIRRAWPLGRKAPLIKHLPLMYSLSCILLHHRIEHQDVRVALTSM